MRQMRWLTALGALLVAAPGIRAQQAGPQAYPLEVRVWLDRGDEPVLRRGDRVRMYYRTSEDAWVAIFHIDTDGAIRLLFPRSPEESHLAAGGRDYRLLFPRSPYWYVDEYEGKGYFFAVASPRPFEFSRLRYVAYEKAWDLAPVGRTVYQDPYLAMDDYVAALIPDWETVPYALDFISYDVGGAHEYPRFLCYDCHGFRSFATWNPYTYACTSFRVVIWDDPYFYPAYRYGPTRVVFNSPPRGRVRFEFKERAPGEAWSPLQRTRQPAQRRTPQYLEPSVADPDRPRVVPPTRRVVPSGGTATGPDRAGASTARPPARRPSASGGSGATTVVPPARRPSDPSAGARVSEPRGEGRAVTPPSRPAQERPILQRRPATPSSSARPPASRPDEPRARPQGPTRIIRPSPSGGVRPATPSRPSARPSTPAAGGTRVVRPPTSGRPSVRPPARPGAGSRPSAGSRPGGSSARPAPRPAPSRPQVKPKRPPPKRPGGSGGPGG